MRKPLTIKTLEALKPQSKRYMVHDLHCPGLAVRVSESGQLVFVANYRYGLEQRRQTLGAYPIITLVEAREKARGTRLGYALEMGGGGVWRLDLGTIWRVKRFLDRTVTVEGVRAGFDLLDVQSLRHVAEP